MDSADKTEIINDLMNRYGTELLRLCCCYVKNEHMAQDIVQDTFVKIFMKYDDLRGDAAVKTWIYSIAVNTCKDYIRKNVREYNAIGKLSESMTESYDNHENYGEFDELTDIINSLKPKYKEVILLFYYSQMSSEEISKTLSVSISAVNTRLYRARAMIKDRLD